MKGNTGKCLRPENGRGNSPEKKQKKIDIQGGRLCWGKKRCLEHPRVFCFSELRVQVLLRYFIVIYTLDLSLSRPLCAGESRFCFQDNKKPVAYFFIEFFDLWTFLPTEAKCVVFYG